MGLYQAGLPPGPVNVTWQPVRDDHSSRYPNASTAAAERSEFPSTQCGCIAHDYPATPRTKALPVVGPAVRSAVIFVITACLIVVLARFPRDWNAITRHGPGPSSAHGSSPTPDPTIAQGRGNHPPSGADSEVPANLWSLEVPGAQPISLLGVLPFEAVLGHVTEPNNQPREVVVTKSFSISAYQVTVGQFSAFVRATNYISTAETAGGDTGKQVWAYQGTRIAPQAGLSWSNPGFPQDERHPVTSVSWNDAQAFCVWLSGRTGRPVRLPTEAEWEYCAGAGARTKYWWGDSPDAATGNGNFGDQAKHALFPLARGYANWDDGCAHTAPVGAFRPNPMGLYDAGGNVWEWCHDRYEEKLPPGRVIDPYGPPSGDVRAFRGSSFVEFPPHGLAHRYGNQPTIGCNLRGFRVVVAEEWRTLATASTIIPATEVTRRNAGTFVAMRGEIVGYVPSREPRSPHVLTVIDRAVDPLEIVYWPEAAEAIHAELGLPRVGMRVAAAGTLADYKGRLQLRVHRPEQIRFERAE